MLVRYFDPNLKLWLTSFGVAIIVGNALYISTTGGKKNSIKLDFWQTFRFFLIPFSVSSFSALVKGRGFILIFSPKLAENLVAAGLCAALCAATFLMKPLFKEGSAELSAA